MATIEALEQASIQQQLSNLPNWEIKDEKLYRRLMFENFIGAFGFMTQVAILAEKANHHPEWANVYRTVDIFLTTHEAGGISQKDFDLAVKINKLITG